MGLLGGLPTSDRWEFIMQTRFSRPQGPRGGGSPFPRNGPPRRSPSGNFLSGIMIGVKLITEGSLGAVAFDLAMVEGLDFAFCLNCGKIYMINFTISKSTIQ